MSEKRQGNEFLSLSLKLMLISAAVVLLLSCVNFITKDIIAANHDKKVQAAIAEIFPEGESSILSFELTEEEAKYVSDIYAVRTDGYITGYCITLKSPGFSGDISMIVGISSGSKIMGVKIISHTETPNIGARVLTEGSFLSSFTNVYSQNLSGVDGVSGATVTTDAVIKGVATATELADRIISGNG